MTTIGLEEEFMLLDPRTLAPVGRAAEVIEAVRVTVHAPFVTSEFYASQLEYASPILSTSEDASRELGSFRVALAEIATRLGVVAAGVGLPFDVTDDARLTPGARYLDIADHFGAIVADHQLNGLHVHVGVPDREAAIRASNRLRPWLPALLALSGNSPFWHGRDTGFASWRCIHIRRWTTSGIPPYFRDADDYDARATRLLGVGGTTDIGTLNWAARPSAKYPTVEVRVFDAQLDATTSIPLALLTRGVIASPSDDDEPALPQELLDAALWHAARYGMSAGLVDPASGSMRPAAEVVRRLLQVAKPGLEAHGDHERVAAFVDRTIADGTGADRQRRAYARGGRDGLGDLLAHL
ncbi:carboxylate-amine ligase [Glaciibacter flavus]|nr:YbdK family carboxylate-amine ligase [Glaciibacter flavus]